MEIKDTYDHSTVTVEFTYGRPYRRTHMGKHWPITTQCVIKRDGLVIGVGEAVKHEKDTNNLKYGRKYAAMKAFNQAKFKTHKEQRTRLWKQILEIK